MSKKTIPPLKKVIIIGGSQGAMEALLSIIPVLPPGFPAAVLVVVHLPVDADGLLPRILSRGFLKAFHPKDRQVLRAGNIYAAPPDHHLTLEDSHMRVLRGPRENRHRPAIDPLFRTAARMFGRDVIAVLLSGNLDDGAAGLFAVRELGGTAIVQDPATALAGEMPQRGLDYAGADYVLPAEQIGAKLAELTHSRDKVMNRHKNLKSRKKKNDPEVFQNEEVSYIGESNGKPSVFACPECHGTLWELRKGKIRSYRCRVGHAFTFDSLGAEIDQSTERALWAAMRALEERAAVAQRVLDRPKVPMGQTRRVREQIEADTANARLIRKMIFTAD